MMMSSSLSQPPPQEQQQEQNKRRRTNSPMSTSDPYRPQLHRQHEEESSASLSSVSSSNDKDAHQRRRRSQDDEDDYEKEEVEEDEDGGHNKNDGSDNKRNINNNSENVNGGNVDDGSDDEDDEEEDDNNSVGAVAHEHDVKEDDDHANNADHDDGDEEDGATIDAAETEEWQRMYAQLVRYLNQHAHTVVPHDYKELGRWVSMQRANLLILTEHRKRLLDGIGFVWSTTESEQWQDMFDRLRHYQQVHRHATADSSNNDDSVGTAVTDDRACPGLKWWVNLQQTLYSTNVLQPERIRLLRSIGFEFGASSSVGAAGTARALHHHNGEQTRQHGS
jgi:Helicase associated domain